MEINTTPNATNQRKGVAKFDSTQFEVENGNVKLNVDDTPVNGELKQPVSSNWAYDHEADTTTHGATGAVVGTTNTQELTNKTLDSSVLKGTFTASGTVTLPSFTEAGNITMPAGGTVGLTGALITHTANAPTLDAGSGSLQVSTTGAQLGIKIVSTNTGNLGPNLIIYQNSTSPENNDYCAGWLGRGNNNAVTPEETFYAGELVKIVDVTDGQEDGQLEFWTMLAGSSNQAAYITNAGALYLDATGDASATCTLFDDYDDALVLKQAIQQNNREMLVDMGICERKNTGSGYMLKLQPMLRLLAGGIYQTREMLEELKEENRLLKQQVRLLTEGAK